MLVVDDNVEFLDSLVAFLEEINQFQIVGCAHSGEEAIRLTSELSPDLILIDVAMPGMSGFEAARRIKSRPRPPRIVIVALFDNPGYRAIAETVGSDGFVSKGKLDTQLLPMIEGIFNRFPLAGG